MKNIAPFFILLILAYLLTPLKVEGAAVQVVDVVWGSPNSPERAIPGDENIQLSLVVANIGNKPVCTLEAEILPKQNTHLPVTSWDGSRIIRAYHQGQLLPGTMATLIFRVNIANDYTPGRYEAVARLTYRECSSTSDYLPISQQTATIYLQIWRPPALRLVKSAWLVNGVEKPVGPGTGLAILKLFIEAPLETSVRSVEAWLNAPPSFRLSTGGKGLSDTFLETVPAGGFFTLEFPLVLSDDVQLGNHQFELDLRFKNKYGTLIRQKLPFTVELSGREVLEVKSRPQSFYRGDHALLSLLVENTGTAPAYNVEMEVRSDSPKVQVLMSTANLGNLNPGQALEVKVPLYVERSAEASVYTVISTLVYRDGLGNHGSKSFKTSFTVSEEFRTGVEVSPSQHFIQAAAITPLKINIVNTNPYTINEVKITLVAHNTLLTVVEGPTMVSISQLAPNAAYSIPLKVLAAPQAGDSVSLLQARVEYKDEAGVRWVDTVDIPLAVRADIEIKFKGVRLSPLKVRPGETVDVAGDIVNEGSNIARAVSAEVVGTAPFENVGESLAFVGVVNPSQVSAFTLNFRVSHDAKPGTYQVTVKAVYRNGFGETFTKETTLSYEVVAASAPTITVREQQQPATTTQSLVAISIAAAAIIASAYIIIRRKRRAG
ncbi:MAG: hypothetical protein QXZ62_05480 [Candidatus Caldarchaeum sp.]